MNRLYYILWPSFLVAGIVWIAFFAIIDPQELQLFDDALPASSLATYSIGFLALWAACAASCYVTCFLQRSGTDINRASSHHAPPPAPAAVTRRRKVQTLRPDAAGPDLKRDQTQPVGFGMPA